jgi:hypothetical protein
MRSAWCRAVVCEGPPAQPFPFLANRLQCVSDIGVAGHQTVISLKMGRFGSARLLMNRSHNSSDSCRCARWLLAVLDARKKRQSEERLALALNSRRAIDATTRPGVGELTLPRAFIPTKGCAFQTKTVPRGRSLRGAIFTILRAENLMQCTYVVVAVFFGAARNFVSVF